jgi:hypothetical protein
MPALSMYGTWNVLAGDVLPRPVVAAALVHVIDLQTEIGRQLLLELRDVLVAVRRLEVRVDAQVWRARTAADVGAICRVPQPVATSRIDTGS